MVRINTAEYEATVAKLKKINDRANRRGFTGRIELMATEIAIESTDDFGFVRTEVWYDVELSGTAPRYDDWTFLAVLDWDPEVGLIVRSAPGADPVDRTRLRKDRCDHCCTTRHRNQTYVVQGHRSGQQLQVGSTCIKDFLGWKSGIVFLDEDTVGQELGFGSFGGGVDRVGTQYALAVAWALIRLNGYKPAGSPGSTKGDVLDVLFPPRHMDPQRHAELLRIRELATEAMDQAAQCLAWVLSEEFGGDSDYVQNLKAIARAESVGGNHIGLLASAPQAWAKWQEKTLIKGAETISEWVGEVGQRLVLAAKIHAISYIPGTYGTTVLYSLRDAAGNIIKWFASREALGDKTGEEVTLKATIKALETFKDVKQTLITRAKVLA